MTETVTAHAEFAAWAAAERADWDPTAVDQVLVAARMAGWEWPRIVREIVRLVFVPGSSLWELRRVIADTRRAGRPADPEAKAALIAEAKAACEEATERQHAREDGRGAS